MSLLSLAMNFFLTYVLLKLLVVIEQFFFNFIIKLLFSLRMILSILFIMFIMYHNIITVLQSMKAKEREALTPIALRKRAAEYAGEAINTQRDVRTHVLTYLSFNYLYFSYCNIVKMFKRILIILHNDMMNILFIVI